MNKQLPLILVTNDDGIEAPGVRRLIDCVAPMAEVVCVCPSRPHSGMSMALTVNDAIRVRRCDDYRGAAMYAVGGTPADCVKIARHSILERKPDMVLSGINHGSNAGVNVLYSGTMGAALEGCALGIPSVGFSLTDHAMDADFQPCYPFISEICGRLLQCGLPDGICLNVNIPNSGSVPDRMRVVRQCRSSWSDEYKQYTDPFGRPFYMISGSFVNDEPDNTDTDQWCLSHGIVAVVPVTLDRTAPHPGHAPQPAGWTAPQLDALAAFETFRVG